jgi:hypothetical protein
MQSHPGSSARLPASSIEGGLGGDRTGHGASWMGYAHILMAGGVMVREVSLKKYAQFFGSVRTKQQSP